MTCLELIGRVLQLISNTYRITSDFSLLNACFNIFWDVPCRLWHCGTVHLRFCLGPHITPHRWTCGAWAASLQSLHARCGMQHVETQCGSDYYAVTQNNPSGGKHTRENQTWITANYVDVRSETEKMTNTSSWQLWAGQRFLWAQLTADPASNISSASACLSRQSAATRSRFPFLNNTCWHLRLTKEASIAQASFPLDLSLLCWHWYYSWYVLATKGWQTTCNGSTCYFWNCVRMWLSSRSSIGSPPSIFSGFLVNHCIGTKLTEVCTSSRGISNMVCLPGIQTLHRHWA